MSIISEAAMRMLTSTTKSPGNTLVLGSAPRASKFYEEMLQREGPGRVRLIGANDLRDAANPYDISRIVIVDPQLDEDAELAEALIDYKLRGVKIETFIDSYEKMSRKIWLEGLSPEWLILADGFRSSAAYLNVKRIFDIILSVLLLALTAPLVALVALAVRRDSPGAAIFRQERVGLNGRRFTLYKFRSMRLDAEKNGPAWATEQDDRCTRVGKFLRKSRLDELPQLINVLRGDMSFVGPRPERPYFVDLLKEKIRYYDLRHYVKPGITGWAQVMYPYGASVEDAYQKLQYDLYYAKNVSLSLDLLVLLKTIKVVLMREGR